MSRLRSSSLSSRFPRAGRNRLAEGSCEKMVQAPTVSELLAFIDLDPNAVRCLLVRVLPRVGFEVLRQERVQTRLGGGHPGTLSQASIKATLVSVRRFLRDGRRKEQLGGSAL